MVVAIAKYSEVELLAASAVEVARVELAEVVVAAETLELAAAAVEEAEAEAEALELAAELETELEAEALVLAAELEVEALELTEDKLEVELGAALEVEL